MQTDCETVTKPPAYATQRGTATMLLITGLVGMIATLILFHERVQLWQDPTYVTSCDLSPWVSCGQVMESWQAKVFGFPNILIGLLGFPVIITIAMALYAGAQFSRWFWVATSFGTLAGLVFCLWLWSQAVYVINVLCLYCMVVWAAVIPMAVLTLTRNMLVGVFPVSPKVASWADSLAWPVIIGFYSIIIGSILVRFGSAIF